MKAAVIAGACLLLALLAGGAVATEIAVSHLDQQVSSLQGKMRTEQTANTALHGQLATVQTETAALNKNSPTGTLITCSDLSDFQKNASMSVSVFNSQYGISSDGSGFYQGNPWLPSHCLKQ